MDGAAPERGRLGREVALADFEVDGPRRQRVRPGRALLARDQGRLKTVLDLEEIGHRPSRSRLQRLQEGVSHSHRETVLRPGADGRVGADQVGAVGVGRLRHRPSEVEHPLVSCGCEVHVAAGERGGPPGSPLRSCHLVPRPRCRPRPRRTRIRDGERPCRPVQAPRRCEPRPRSRGWTRSGPSAVWAAAPMGSAAHARPSKRSTKLGPARRQRPQRGPLEADPANGRNPRAAESLSARTAPGPRGACPLGTPPAPRR